MTDQRPTDKHHLRLAPIEPEEYDALADLFLGDSPLAPEPSGVYADREIGVVVEDEIYEDDSFVDLPCPPERARLECVERASEAEAAGTAHEPVLSGADEHGCEADVQIIGRIEPAEEIEWDDGEGLSEGVGFVPSSAEVEGAKRPAVEVVLLGHLPVRATLWVRQYACAVARERGETVALIRAASGSTAVDLITGDRPVESRPAVSIAHALEKAAYLADRVIVRVDEAAEPDLLERGEIDRVTILTGADETAVVASYRLIKTLTASWEWDDEGVADLRMAVMGGTNEQSADARAKLTRAVESFLDHPIEIVVSAGRIDSTGTMNLYRDDVAHPASHILDGLLAGATRGRAEMEAKRSADDRPVSPMELLREDIDALETLDALARRVRSETLSEMVDEPDMDEESEPVSRQQTGSAGSAAVEYRTTRNTLSALIDGLEMIEARCPSAPGVELAADRSGCVHLVTDDCSADAVTRLIGAQAWVRDHLALLLRAEPLLTMPESDPRAASEPTLHVLAEHPRELMAVYPTSVRVYAMASVRVGSVVARVATPIN